MPSNKLVNFPVLLVADEVPVKAYLYGVLPPLAVAVIVPSFILGQEGFVEELFTKMKGNAPALISKSSTAKSFPMVLVLLVNNRIRTLVAFAVKEKETFCQPEAGRGTCVLKLDGL